jgi:hypothetical protein
MVTGCPTDQSSLMGRLGISWERLKRRSSICGVHSLLDPDRRSGPTSYSSTILPFIARLIEPGWDCCGSWQGIPLLSLEAGLLIEG